MDGEGAWGLAAQRSSDCFPLLLKDAKVTLEGLSCLHQTIGDLDEGLARSA